MINEDPSEKRGSGNRNNVDEDTIKARKNKKIKRDRQTESNKRRRVDSFSGNNIYSILSHPFSAHFSINIILHKRALVVVVVADYMAVH